MVSDSDSVFPSQLLNVVTYNVFEGFERHKARVDRMLRFCAWVRSFDGESTSRIDVLGLNELNGFTEEELAELGSACGLPYTHLLKATTRFHLGVLSRYGPLEVVDTVAGAGALTNNYKLNLHHGLLHVRIKDLSVDLLITHLTPFDVESRHREIKTILDYADCQMSNQKLQLLMGDFNALSRCDCESHQHERLEADVFRGSSKLRRKFLSEDSMTIDYTSVQLVKDAGWADAACCSTSVRETTVPTLCNADQAHAAPMRLDYIFFRGSPASGPGPGNSSLKVDVIVPKDEITNQISDHFPVMAKLSTISANRCPEPDQLQ